MTIVRDELLTGVYDVITLPAENRILCTSLSDQEFNVLKTKSNKLMVFVGRYVIGYVTLDKQFTTILRSICELVTEFRNKWL